MQTLAYYKIDSDPGNRKVSTQFPTHTSDVIDTGTDLQDGIAAIKEFISKYAR